jgi:hypothetical protein
MRAAIRGLARSESRRSGRSETEPLSLPLAAERPLRGDAARGADAREAPFLDSPAHAARRRVAARAGASRPLRGFMRSARRIFLIGDECAAASSVPHFSRHAGTAAERTAAERPPFAADRQKSPHAEYAVTVQWIQLAKIGSTGFRFRRWDYSV